MNINISRLLAAGVVGTAFAACAVPVVQQSSVSAKQDGLNRAVTIEYQLAGEPGIVTIDIQTNVSEGVWASIGGEHYRTMYGAVNRVNTNLTSKSCAYWQPDVDWESNDPAKVNVRAVVTAWSTNSPPDYMVVDLVVDKGARTYYMAPEQLPDGGLGSDKYKTDYLVMRRIHADGKTFRMGSPAEEPGRRSNETLHYVTLTNDFYMSVYELTQGQYRNVIGDLNPLNTKYGFCATRPLDWLVYDRFRGTKKLWPCDGHEVDPGSPLGVFRSELKISTLDLPTEAEWEFACRAGTLTARYDGSDFPASVAEIAWLGSDRKCPHDVGLLRPNGWGLYDMYGNVDEYCLDYYAEDHSYVTLGSKVIAPNGPGRGMERVIRGTGSWWSLKGDQARSAFRQSYTASGPWMCVGYRLVCR